MVASGFTLRRAQSPSAIVARYLVAGTLAFSGVIGAGIWLGHRLDPTWARRTAPLRRALPFPLPVLPLQLPGGGESRWSAKVAGRPWILELRFPGCGADDGDVSARVRSLDRQVAARTGRSPGWLTLLVGGLPASTNGAAAGGPGRGDRRLETLDPRALAQVAAGLGLADDPRAAGNGLLDARHWMFAVDGAGWVRGAADVTFDDGWDGLQDALIAAAAAPSGTAAHPMAPTGTSPLAPARVPDFVPDFQAVDQDGRPVRARDFAGHPLVIDFIFTRCMGACPMLTARLATLRRMVPDPAARFLSFSVDPANDTPAVLRAYAGRWGAADVRWRLLRADSGTVRAVAAALGEVVLQSDGGPLLHSDHFTLVDPDGVVRGRFASGDPAALQSLADRLTAPVGGGAEPSAAAPEAGARLFASLGCAGCHTNAALAPPLVGVAERRVRLADGRTISADPGYLRQSITAPAAAVVDGFRPTMPSYGGLLSDGELSALVGYLQSR